jgi:hypothetical protein
MLGHALELYLSMLWHVLFVMLAYSLMQLVEGYCVSWFGINTEDKFSSLFIFQKDEKFRLEVLEPLKKILHTKGQ